MRIAILANARNSFAKPMAESLAKRLSEIGELPTVHYNGENYLHCLSVAQFRKNTLLYSKIILKDAAKIILNPLLGNRYTTSILLAFQALEKDLSTSDVIIVVSHLPEAFLPILGIEELRRRFRVPIVLYDLENLLTRGDWINRIQNQGGVGLERYDWYLSVSNISEYPLPRGVDIFSVIGVDLRTSALCPNQQEFLALLDFSREGFENERAIQILALEETNTKYIQLDRPMTIEEIRKIYQKSSLFFLSFRESFGLPIVELQLCGSYICTPFRYWAPSHYIFKSPFERGEGELGNNFIVYNNDKDTLKKQIILLRSAYNPKLVIREFSESYPHLHHGDKGELERFTELLKKGSIHADSHRTYSCFNQQIVTSLDD